MKVLVVTPGRIHLQDMEVARCSALENVDLAGHFGLGVQIRPQTSAGLDSNGSPTVVVGRAAPNPAGSSAPGDPFAHPSAAQADDPSRCRNSAAAPAGER